MLPMEAVSTLPSVSALDKQKLQEADDVVSRTRLFWNRGSLSLKEQFKKESQGV